MDKIFEQALGVESPWFIESTTFDTLEKRLDIRIDFKRGWRFPLEEGGPLFPVHDTEVKTWRHLNFFQHECYLHVRVPRIRTDEGRTIMVMPPWAGKMLGFTLLFEALLLELCRNMPVHKVAGMTGVDDGKLWRMLDLYVDCARIDEDCSSLAVVGMDETSVAKGHDYITLFVDMKERKTLHVSEGKGSETVSNFADYLTEHKGNPEQIKAVSCDMSPAYIKGVNDNLPNAEITFDKFHILKIINDGVDKVRREEAKGNPLLKKTRYIFLKNDTNLTAKQRAKKEELKLADLNLQSMEALRMRETFQQIYHADTEATFTKLLQEWIDWVLNCNLPAMQKAAQTVRQHSSGIINWVQSRINNGILEGLNSIVQAAKRKARGYGKKHFATMVFLLTGKLNFQKVNHFLPTRFE
jgi:transposase